MPRDGSNVYHTPAGTDAVTNTTISSSAYNTNVHDVETDLNTPRPVVAGGTGASNALTARKNIGAEAATQVVANYDSMVFEAGSFYSAAGATNPPVAGHAFSGICYLTDANNVVIEARDATTGLKYARVMTSGTWGAWSGVEDAQYVKKAGDTMTGNLQVGTTSPIPGSILVGMVSTAAFTGSTGNYLANAYINTGGTAYQATAAGYVGGLVYGTSTGTWSVKGTTASQGQDATVTFTDLATLDKSGNLNLGGNIISNGLATVIGNAQTTGTLYFTASSNNRTLAWDGSKFALSGQLSVNGSINATAYNINGISLATNDANNNTLYSGGVSQHAALYLGGTGASNANKYAATTHGFVDAANSTLFAQIDATQILSNVKVASIGYLSRAGSGGAFGTNLVNFNWVSGTGCQLWIDGSNAGIITVSSDYRIKKDVTDLAGMWEKVKALRPIKYTQAQFTPPAQIALDLEERTAAEARGDTKPADPYTPLFVADDVERWGFIAHELQETLVPSAATGEKDSPDTIQSPNPFTVIAALTKALQEAMGRIEALEAK
jgi:hypothetical protein